MPTCIICRTEKVKFNKEHVIPEALGGKFWIRSVCEECNSRLGSKVDCHLTNAFFNEFKRAELKLAGRSGKIPDPLAGKVHLTEDPSKILYLKRTNEGVLYPLPRPAEIKMDNPKSQSFGISGSMDEIKKSLKRYLEKHKISPDRVHIQKLKIVKPKGAHIGVQKKFLIDALGLYRAVLKIAYEFTTTVVPAYFNCENAKIMSRQILDEGRAEPEPSFFHENNIVNELKKTPPNDLIFNDDNHAILLLQVANGLICIVNIFANVYTVKMSNETNILEPGVSIVLRNDVLNGVQSELVKQV